WRGPGGIRIRPLRKRLGIYYRVEVPRSVSGATKWKIFKTVEEAEGYASLFHVQRQNQGLSSFVLTDSQRADAQSAFALMSDISGVTLTDVVKFYRKHFLPEGGDITVRELVDRYLRIKQTEKLKE